MTVKKRVIFLAALLSALVAFPVIGDESTARTKDVRALTASLEYFTAWFDCLVDAVLPRAHVENAPNKKTPMAMLVRIHPRVSSKIE